jgi:FixJ family two-component response regulator
MATVPLVFVVDPDVDVRELLAQMLADAGIRCVGFDSAEAFLDSSPPDRLEPRCLVVDVRLPGLSGLDLLRILLERGWRIPVVVLTAQGDVPMAVTAMKWGAADFLEKPLHRTLLLRRIREALDQDAHRVSEIFRRQQVEERLASLTPRELEILGMLVQGKKNKCISAELNITFQTAAKHTSRVLEKTGVETAVELARLLMEVRPRQLPSLMGEESPRSSWIGAPVARVAGRR